MTQATTKQAKELFAPFQKHLRLLDRQEQYHPIVRKGDLEKNNFKAIFPGAQWHTSKYMEPQLAADLKHGLIEPDFAAPSATASRTE